MEFVLQISTISTVQAPTNRLWFSIQWRSFFWRF